MSARRFRRQQRKRKTLKRVLLVCEGRSTERIYFDQLKREDAVSERFSIKVKKSNGGSREQIANYAIDRKNDVGADFDEVWCIMDVEGHDHRESLLRALPLLKRHKISVCLSNPSFEIWYLSHFLRTAAAFNDCGAVIVKLNKHWRNHFGCEYNKSDEQAYRRLCQFTQIAIANAGAVRANDHGNGKCIYDCNSSTDVYSLVNYLLTGN